MTPPSPPARRLYDWKLLAHYFQVNARAQCHDLQPGMSDEDVQHLEKSNPRLFAEMLREFKELDGRSAFHLPIPKGSDKFKTFLEYYKFWGSGNLHFALEKTVEEVVKAKGLPPCFLWNSSDGGNLIVSNKKLLPQEIETLGKGIAEFLDKKGINSPTFTLEFTQDRPHPPLEGTVYCYRLSILTNDCKPAVPQV
jgi:hypothetical protein